MENNEIWLPVRNSDRYMVSNLGRVKTIKFRYGGEWVLTPKVTKANYHFVVLLGLDGAKSTRAMGISKLVAEAFIPNPMEYTEVRHLDGDKSNNTVENLEWVESDRNNRKGSPFIYKIHHQDTPEDVKVFRCQHDAEIFMRDVRGLKNKPNLNHHIQTHKGAPDSLGYCVERIRLSKSDYEVKRAQK